jgi:hypothetical protein
MHINSTLFLIFFLFRFIRFEDERQGVGQLKDSLACIAAILALFTYDQSASVVLVFSVFLLARSVSNSPIFHKIPVRKLSWPLTSLLALSSIMYILVFLNGRGIGENLTIGSNSAERLIGNLILPLKIFRKISSGESSKIASYLGGNTIVTLICLIALTLVLSLTFTFLFRNRRQGLVDARALSLAILFVSLSFISYLPAASWYVAPRHLFLPAVLFSLGSAFALSSIGDFFSRSVVSRIFRPIAALLVFGLLLSFNAQSAQWVARDEARKILYQQFNDLINTEHNGACIVVNPDVITGEGLLYSESFESARKYYAGESLRQKIGECQSAPIVADGKYLCDWESGQTNWLELTSFRQSKISPIKFTFLLTEICKTTM